MERTGSTPWQTACRQAHRIAGRRAVHIAVETARDLLLHLDVRRPRVLENGCIKRRL